MARHIDILMIDDDPVDGEIFQRHCRKVAEYEVTFRQSCTLDEGLAAIAENTPDLVVLDCMIPPYSCPSETIAPIRDSGYAGPVVISSGTLRSLLPLSEGELGKLPYVCKGDIDADVIRGLLRDQLPALAAASG